MLQEKGYIWNAGVLEEGSEWFQIQEVRFLRKITLT